MSECWNVVGDPQAARPSPADVTGINVESIAVAVIGGVVVVAVYRLLMGRRSTV